MKAMIVLALCVAVCYGASVPLADIKYRDGPTLVEEKGMLKEVDGSQVEIFKGDFTFQAPDTRKIYKLTWNADENGFVAKGDHLPTPPPLPVLPK